MSRSIVPRALSPVRPWVTPLLLPLLLLTACSGGGSDDPGALSADESRQLDDAAAMLDANRIDLDATTPSNATDAP